METPRKRLVPFMKRMIGRCPGVVWHEKENGSFRIPWRHYNNRDWSEDDSKIFQEWAKLTGKYKPGDDCDWPAWKTQLRCALNKIPDIEPVSSQHQPDDPNPYRVYRFVSAAQQASSPPGNLAGEDSDSSPVMSPESVMDENRMNSPPMEQIDRYVELDIKRNSTCKWYKFPFEMPDANLPLHGVPTVVMEAAEKNKEDHAHYTNLKNADMTEYICNLNTKQEPIFLGYNSSQAQVDQIQPVDYLTDLTEVSCPQPMTYQKSIPLDNMNPLHVGASASVEQEFNNNITSAPNTVSSNPSAFQQQSESIQMDTYESSLPSDLKSLESGNLCRLETSLPTETTSIPSSFGSNMSGIRREIQSLDKNVFSIRLFYGADRGQEVLRKSLTEKGCNLHFSRLGTQFFQNTFLDKPEVFGPPTVEKLEMPGVEHLSSIEEAHRDKLSQLLDNMERGLVLTVEGRDIFAQRLCKTRVFVTDGTSHSNLIERNSTGPCRVKVFDFDEQQRKKQPKVTLTFGQEIKIGHRDPLKRVLMSMELQHEGLHSALLEEESSMGSSANFFSNDDLNDQIIKQFKAISVDNVCG